jgi:hypothetical protein
MEKEMISASKIAGATLVILLLASGVARADLVRNNDPLSPGDFFPDSNPVIDAPVISVEPRDRLSPDEIEEMFDGASPGGIIDRDGDKVPYFPIDIKGTQVERPGTIYPKTKTYYYKPTISFGGAGQGGDSHTIDIAVACEVAGTPTEFPDDLVLVNLGATLSSGTTIMWKIKSVDQGYVRLNRELPEGGKIKASDVLDAGVEAGRQCSAKVI